VFGLEDFLGFLIAFFIIFPLCTVIHLLGHLFFLLIFGGKGIRVVMGSGPKVFSTKYIEVHKFYFWYGGCYYRSLKIRNTLTTLLILIGGSLFNLLTIVSINGLMYIEILKPAPFWDNFMYFSLYFAFLAFFPMRYPDGTHTDGKAAIQSLQGKDIVDTSSDLLREQEEEENGNR
jgi:hypothetical protein